MVDYIFKPYNPIYPALFKKEKERVEKYLTSKYKIEHFGSTAVPNLAGKGIIDFYVLVAKEDIEKTKKEIEKAGYESRPKSGTKERFIFVREIIYPNREKERYHLHLTNFDSEDAKDNILFRDYLRKHPEDAERYAKAKQKAAKEAKGLRDRYLKLKSPIMEEILKKAKKTRSKTKLSLYP